MTTTIVLASSNDGYVGTGVATWNDAINGFSPTAVNGGNELVYGVDQIGLGYSAYEAFIEFAYTRPANHTEMSAVIGIRHSQHHGTVSRRLLVYGYDWGATVDAADWRNPLSIFAPYPLATEFFDTQAASTSQYMYAGSDELINQLRTGGTASYRYFLATDRQLTYDLASGLPEWSAFWSAETSLDPTMVVSSMIRNTLTEVLGAQVQLSDGTWAVLESNGAASSPTILLRHVDTSGTAATKATIPTTPSDSGAFNVGSASVFSTGAQQLALVVDDSDNLYVIGWRCTTSNDIACKAYIKGAGYTWTPQTTAYGSLPGSDTDPTNFAAAWHSVGSGGGTIMVMISRQASDGYRGINSEMCWALLSCQAALTFSGTLIRSTYIAPSAFVPQISSATWISQTNETGTGLDVCALSATKGVIHTWSRRNRLGANQPTCKTRYTLNSSGTGFDSFFYEVPETSAGTWGVKTSAGKLRVIPIDSETCAVLSSDSDVGWGLTAAIIRNSGATTTWTLLGRVRLGNESIATMPSPSTLAETQAWDAALVSGPGKLWVYYFDTANAQRLMRTAINLSTYTATREEVQVSASVGAVGSTNLAIRTARDSASPRRVLITVANRTAGGTLSTIYLVDTPNEAPTGPTLATRANFDAGSPAAFTWTFNDPDIGDTQTSFQVDINTSVGVDVYDTGRLTGAITYRGIGAVAVGNNTSVVPALPAGWQPGDLLVIVAAIRNSGTGTVDTPAGWTVFRTSGNVKVLGRIARTGDVAPTVTFTGGVANATTQAQCFALSGTDQDITTVLVGGADQLNASGQNIAIPALATGNDAVTMVVIGWKQDDWTSVATLAGQFFTEISDSPTTTGDDAGLEIQYRLGGFAGAGTVSATSFTVTGGAAAISRGLTLAFRPYTAPTSGTFTLPANILTNGVSYQWRVKTWDQAGAEGAWSSYGTFSAGSGGTVTVTDPATDNPANIITSTYTVSWSLTGATQAAYRVVVRRNDTLAEVYNSGWVTSTATSQGITGMVSDVEHQIQVTTRTAGLVESNTGTRLITPSYATPDEATVTATVVTASGHTLISVSNPAPTGDRPDVDYNQIQRRALTGDDAGEDWVTIGAVAVNGQWEDHTAASNVTYEYRSNTVAVDGNESQTDTVEATLCLQGVWIHDPTDPSNVDPLHYMYGGSGKGDELESTAEGIHYAGRALPVYEFGEHENEIVDVPIQVPFSDTWAAEISDLFALARARTVLVVRDARGRRVFGVITKVSRSDTKWGTEVSFAVTRVDYDETWEGGP